MYWRFDANKFALHQLPPFLRTKGIYAIIKCLMIGIDRVHSLFASHRESVIVQLVVVAMMVILVDQVLKAYAYSVSKTLSVYIGLIITNCIVMGRIEAYALGNKPFASLMDGLGNGLGYAMILVIVAFFRELLGSGTLFGFQVIPQAVYDFGYVNNGLMILPPMALILLGCIIWVQRSIQKDLQEK